MYNAVKQATHENNHILFAGHTDKIAFLLLLSSVYIVTFHCVSLSTSVIKIININKKNQDFFDIWLADRW